MSIVLLTPFITSRERYGKDIGAIGGSRMTASPLKTVEAGLFDILRGCRFTRGGVGRKAGEPA